MTILIIICRGSLEITTYQFGSVQWLSHVWFFATPWTAARQASLSITNSQSLLKLMSIALVMPSNHLFFCVPFSSHLQSFPASGSFPVSWFFTSGDQSIGASASTSVLPMNIQGWCWSWSCNTWVTWCKELTHWKRPWGWKGLGAGGEGDDRGWGWHHRLDGYEFRQTLGVGDGHGGLACCGSWGRKE